MTPFVALSVVLTASQSLRRNHFIAAFDASMGIFRTQTAIGGRSLAVAFVHAHSTLSGARPLHLVHLHTQVRSYDITTVFRHRWRGIFGSIAAAGVNTRHDQQRQGQQRVGFHICCLRLSSNCSRRF
uniref:Putative secreted protein n=1 Tax=Psorophora albipes TaxID=869069 RepID=T1E389_9DIPT